MKEDFLQDLGIFNTAGIYRNLTPAELTEIALMRGDAEQARKMMDRAAELFPNHPDYRQAT